MAQEIYLTKAGFEKLREELENLKTVERRRIARAIGEARLQGDISENAEYDAAKDAQAHCEARIAELEVKLAKVRIIENEDIPSDKVFIGAIVTLKDLDTGEETKYTLVSPEEANYEQGKISIFSPVGKSLMGHSQNEEVVVRVPAGDLKYKIISIDR
ncbi:MAG TPA: transcription elongation factor GreA [Candidatus Omnitrophota bacterium]|nr:transcription elongation factor GreA [Candidatus Omnitrophota bacterium]HPD84205.1 transcription elongation factor GreA [Candidatus Omnitrophota bacterium]HRZ03061.1 transcription elongation factor GreA [Candidatus Omnitrophota bacterium]